jgi:hypothetical protein
MPTADTQRKIKIEKGKKEVDGIDQGAKHQTWIVKVSFLF